MLTKLFFSRSSAHSANAVRISLRTKLTLLIAFVVIVSASILNWTSYRFAHESLTTQIHDRLDAVMHYQSARLESYVSQQQERVKLVATRTRLRQYLSDRLAGRLTDNDEFLAGTQDILRDAKASSPEFFSISITDAAGTVVTSTDNRRLGQDLSASDEYRQGLRAAFLGAPFRRNGVATSYLTAPAKAKDGSHLGVVFVELDVTDLEALMSDIHGLGETGELLAASLEGDRLHYLIPPADEFAAKTTDPAEAAPMMQAIELGSGRDVGRYGRREVLAVWKPINFHAATHRRWGLVAKMDADEAYAPVAGLVELQWLLQISLALMAVLGALVASSHFTRPIFQLIRTAREISSGDLDARVPITTTDELSELAATFNEMTDRLAQSRSSLERQIGERTRELASLNELLLSTNKNLERSNEELEQFAYVASHDLQEPLRKVSAFCGMLKEKCRDDLDDDANRYIDFAVDGARRMKDLITDLLTYSRVQSETIETTTVDSAAVFDDTIWRLENKIQDADAEVTSDELPLVLGDHNGLQQVLQNLIGNALTYRAKDRPTKIHVGVKDEGDFWKFSVSDNGIGIDGDYHSRIFEIFKRLHSHSEVPGTGIGLALCKRIIDRLGGEIWVESEIGVGSTFHFTVPHVVSEVIAESQLAHPSLTAALV